VRASASSRRSSRSVGGRLAERTAATALRAAYDASARLTSDGLPWRTPTPCPSRGGGDSCKRWPSRALYRGDTVGAVAATRGGDHPRCATVSAAANHRYLDALAVVDDPAPAQRALDRLGQPVRDRHGRSSSAFNPAAAPDHALFAAVLRGGTPSTASGTARCARGCSVPPAAADRRSAQVSRLVKRLHFRGLVAKIPRSRRWRITQLDHTVMSGAIQLREEEFPTAFLKAAATLALVERHNRCSTDLRSAAGVPGSPGPVRHAWDGV